MSVTVTTLGEPTDARAVARCTFEGPLTEKDMDRIWQLAGTIIGPRERLRRDLEENHQEDEYQLVQAGAEALAQAAYLYTAVRSNAEMRGIMVTFNLGERTEVRLTHDPTSKTWSMTSFKTDSLGPR